VVDARAAGFQYEALLLAPPADSRDSAGGKTPDLATDILQAAEMPIETLTARERDVLRWLALGLPNKGIAAKLGISDQTVKFHVAAIIGKLGAVNRTDAVRRAARRGLIDL
jgi:DNA-binding NarL/FixJ family response regulator